MFSLRHLFNRVQVLNLVKQNRWYCRAASDGEVQKSDFDHVYDLFQSKNYPVSDKSTADDGQTMTFAALLRNSSFIDLGDPEGKIVRGKVFHVVENDLYIDFNWKFYCVCPRPKKRANEYVRGSDVKLLIKSLELSSKFLGYEKDLTLLEADCILLGLLEK